MRLFSTLLALGLLSGCPVTPAPTKAEKGSASRANDLPAVQKVDVEMKSVRADGGPLPEQEPVADPDPAVAAPAWFDATTIPDAKVLQPTNRAKIGPNMASSMLLELPAGLTAQDCMTKVREAMAESVSDLAEAVPGDKERLTLQGKTAAYSYTVVCGPGKTGQTTLYLSYVESGE